MYSLILGHCQAQSLAKVAAAAARIRINIQQHAAWIKITVKIGEFYGEKNLGIYRVTQGAGWQ